MPSLKNLFILIIFVFIIKTVVCAQEENLFTPSELKWINRNKDSLQFVPECFFPPLVYKDSTGIIKGLSIDYLKEVERLSGIRFKMQECQDLFEILSLAQLHNIDLISSLKQNPRRSLYLDFSHSYIEIPVMIVSNERRLSKLSFSKLDKYKLAIPKGYAINDFLKDNFPHYQIEDVSNDWEALGKLLSNEVDLIILDLATISYLNNKLDIKGVYAVGMVPLNYNLSFACPKNQDTLVMVINKCLSAIPTETKNAIYNKWINFDSDRFWLNRKIFNWVVWSGFSFILLILIILLWNYILQKRVNAKTSDLSHELKLRLKAEIDLIEQNKKYIEVNNELSNMNCSLEEAIEKSKESDRLKTVFLENISHEIRTPLNGILGFTSLLKKEKNNPSKIDVYRQIIQKSGRQLLLIVNNLMDLSKIETGQLDVDCEKVDLKLVLDEVYYVNLPLAKKKNVKLEYVVPSREQAQVITDRLKVIQILNNLVNNALKFTEVGYVKFGIDNNNDLCKFYVKDTGKGISEDFRKRIFDRFSQSETNIPEKHGGAGLGLSISRGLSELLGGDLWFESVENKGTIFHFNISSDLKST